MDVDALRRPLTGLRIMVVEDSTFLGVIIGEMLEEAHCVVLGPFRTVDDATQALGTHTPDAVVLDISIAGDLSFSLAEQIRHRHIPLLLISGYFSHSVPAEFRDGFLQKPFDEAALLEALARVLHRSREETGAETPPNRNHPGAASADLV